jgi:tetratricopeptide (TPR) repeat protein
MLCRSEEEDEQKRCEQITEALGLYKGDFLSKFSSETWVIPISTYFHSVYVDAVVSLCPILFNQNRNAEAVEICRAAISIDPYHEPLYQKLIQALINMGELKSATAVYNELNEKLFNDFGIKPNEETTSIYRMALNSLNDLTVPIDMVMEQVHEADAPDGALECDYDFFKILCFAESRAMLRNGKASHISLGEGLICKGCAKKYFPEGIAYTVTNDYHGKRITPYVGIKRTGMFAYKQEAQAMADECNRKRRDNFSRVEERKV